MRTVCEIVLNENFYLKPDMVSLLDPHGAVLSKNILPATARTTEWVRHSIDTDFAVSVLHSENIESTKDGAWIIICIKTMHGFYLP